MRIEKNPVGVLLAVTILLAGGFAIFLITRTLVAGGAAAPERPAADSVRQTASSSAQPPVPECGEIATTDAYGNPLGDLEPLVRGIHDAACSGDYAGFLPHMESPFNRTAKQDVVTEWEREDSDGFILRSIAVTLEVRAVGDQGGQFFCHPDGAVAVFARGTYDHPGKWSQFDLTGQDRPAACEVAA